MHVYREIMLFIGWLVCDLVVMCVQAVGDRALGDLCVCVRCGSVQSQRV